MRALLLVAFVTAGCVHTVAVPSVAGKAFIVRAAPFGLGSRMWNCDATDGEPVCYETIQQDAAAGK